MLFQISKDFVIYNYHIFLNIIIIVRYKYIKKTVITYMSLVNNFDDKVCWFKPMCFQIEINRKNQV